MRPPIFLISTKYLTLMTFARRFLFLVAVIDIVFFFIELITGVCAFVLEQPGGDKRKKWLTRVSLTPGYAVGSLALVADSFHMLNDVMSLLVALYALKVRRQPSSLHFIAKSCSSDLPLAAVEKD